MNVNDFLKCSREEAVDIVKKNRKPSTGIFVSNGNRRLMLTEVPYPSGRDVYIKNYVALLRTKTLETLQLFFLYGLQNLVLPLFSRSVLERREPYPQIAQEIIGFLFGDNQYLSFYNQQQISVLVYGNLDYLKSTSLDQSHDLVLDCIDRTSSYQKGRIFWGIGSEDEVGTDLFEYALRFISKNGRKPTLQEQKLLYYSYDLPEAEFYIVSSSFKAHVIPPLICGKSTYYYFLPSPSTIGFNETTYRKILFDIIFGRREIDIDFSNLTFSGEVLEELGSRFRRDKNNVIGIGENIGPFWVISTN